MADKAVDLNKQMIKAAKAGDVDAVKALLETDPALINARDSDDSTPLHCASWKGHPNVVSLLLDFGADINAKNNNDHWGNTPLHAAAHGNQTAVAKVLIERGADIHAEFGPGRTPLRETEVHKATAVAKLLRHHGATH